MDGRISHVAGELVELLPRGNPLAALIERQHLHGDPVGRGQLLFTPPSPPAQGSQDDTVRMARRFVHRLLS
jgi:hypothetical protein